MVNRHILLIFIVVSMLYGCYYEPSQTSDAWDLTEKQIDSLSFSSTHHYSQNYNFIVTADSLVLTEQQPAEKVTDLKTDSLIIHHGDRVVVADIQMIPTDSIDSVWIKVARDQSTLGWIHETKLLDGVEPDDPISQFINFFSNTHLLIFMVVICFISVAYLMHYLVKRRARIVHFNDIDSFYPTLLTLIVASAATLYASMQMFVPETWRHFYYHPTLNPFGLPFILAIFIIAVWSIIIVSLASFQDTLHQLHIGESILYMLGLMGICAVDYVVFSIFTLYYIGYALLIAYFVFALWRYFKNSRCYYICGNCGKKIHSKGKCPHCGMINE
jgi:hypothetical protein